MTKTCVVCKKYPVSGDTSRSFHKFPINDDIKKQWMDATGLSKLTVNCTVCSDHFTPQSYHQTEGYTSVKRLLKNAVPIVNKKDISEDAKEPTLKENTKSQIGASLQVTNESHNLSNTSDTVDEESGSNDSSAQSDVDNVGNKLKRKISPTNIRALNIKRMFRYRDGMETKYICREEFVTEEAWEKFLRLMLLNRRRLEGLRQKICRRNKFNESGEEDNASKEMFDPERFLEIILKE